MHVCIYIFMYCLVPPLVLFIFLFPFGFSFVDIITQAVMSIHVCILLLLSNISFDSIYCSVQLCEY